MHGVSCLGAALLLAFTGRAWSNEAVFSQASNDTLLWGPYKPNLYFGIRPRIPKSFSLAMLWSRVDDYDHIAANVRWTCEQNQGMAGYGWDAYDSRRGGIQTIHDSGNDLDIETSFIKTEDGSWAARIKGTPRVAEAAQVRTSLWFSLGLDGIGGLEADRADEGEELGYDGDVVINGNSPELGDFSVTFHEPSENLHPVHKHPSINEKPLDRAFVHSLQVGPEAVWQGKALVYQSIKTTFDNYIEEYGEDTPPPAQFWTLTNQPGPGNVQLVQKIFQGPFELDVIYKPASSNAALDSAGLEKRLKTLRKDFDSTYDQVLKPAAPFTAAKYTEFSKSLFSNLIGGVGYFHGDQVIDRSYAPEYEELNEGFWEEAEDARGRAEAKLEYPYELYTSIPSRPFFPRGFLWDEGFHLLPILEWDADLTMQIISSWFNTMDEDGWIAREQIVGAEARSKVPPEFQVQYPHYANPPTLYLAIEALIDKFTGRDKLAATTGNSHASPENFKSWLQGLYPQLKHNFDWYKKTQFGDISGYDRKAFSTKEGYRWRGRTPRHILTSGLDDYPRAQPPHPGELHTDLLSWMGLAARSLHRIAQYLNELEDVVKYGKVEEAIKHNVDDLHWDEDAKTYCDATIDDYEESVHVCHKGYISVFPFMTGLVGPDHKHLKAVLDLIGDEEELWSPYGIRSLSKKDELYGTDENYWRSPVWMNMNYMILKNLQNIATSKGPQQKRAATMFSALRKNLVDTVYNSWKETGFAWEQYNPETGAGQRTQHFTGWTSLIAKIMAMPVPSSKDIKEEL